MAGDNGRDKRKEKAKETKYRKTLLNFKRIPAKVTKTKGGDKRRKGA